MAASKVAALLVDLNSADRNQRAAATRTLKNRLIGSQRQKRYYFEGGALQALQSLLSSQLDPEIAVEAVSALGSLIKGSGSVTKYAFQAGLVGVLCNLCMESTSTTQVLESCLRTIAIFYEDDEAPRSYMMDTRFISLLISLLNSPYEALQSGSAKVIARGALDDDFRQQVSIENVMAPLLNLLNDTSPAVQEAALEGISSLAHNNPKFFTEMQQCCGVDFPHVFVLRVQHFLARFRPSARIIPARLVLNWQASGALKGLNSAMVSPMMNAVVSSVIKLLSNQVTSTKCDAARVLARAVTDQPSWAVVAIESGALTALVTVMSSSVTPAGQLQAFYGTLYALASSCEDCRTQIAQSLLEVVPHGLEHAVPEVRVAACACLRSISRSVKVLRTSLLEAQVHLPLIRCLYDTDVTVQTEATAALCNFVVDFSPMRSAVLELGVMNRIVELTEDCVARTDLDGSDMDDSGSREVKPVSINALWALKNMLFASSRSVKEQVMHAVTFERLALFLNGPSPAVVEQALYISRNLFCARISMDISWAWIALNHALLQREKGCGLMTLLEKHLQSVCLPIRTQAIYVVCNVSAAAPQEIRNQMMRSRVPKLIVEALNESHDTHAPLVMAALWCVINFTWKHEEGVEERVSLLKELGVEESLMSLEASCDNTDVQCRLRTAKEQISDMPLLQRHLSDDDDAMIA